MIKKRNIQQKLSYLYFSKIIEVYFDGNEIERGGFI